MGYPMTWPRMIHRNGLTGDYDATRIGIISGDLRRVQKDQRDPYFTACYAEYAGVTVEQAKLILDALFDGFPPGLELKADEERWERLRKQAVAKGEIPPEARDEIPGGGGETPREGADEA